MEIIIEQGNEFNYKIGKVDGEDIFINEYNQAALRLEEIVAATINYEKSIENNEKDSKANESDYLNNIIAFTGERGQGKSSAMHSFTQDLLDYKKKKESHIEYQEKTKTATFLKLDTIDPSTFEDMHNVLEVVIARMYNNLENEYSEGKDDKFKTRAKECKIFDSFQKVYELLSFIRNPKKLDGLENDYEGSLQKIARIGDSTNLKKEMQKLVKSYLELFKKDAEHRFLIVPIDDLDINIEHAYKISEQIRKYLMIPHVVIIMAVKVEQLKQCIETVYRKQLEELIKAGERITKEEPINMAAKYVEKLIPDGRKISLPEIRAISQSGKDAVKIVFLGKELDDKITEEKYKKKVNILKDYKSNSGNSELGIEKTLLAYIYDKTEIVFVKPDITVHPIVPNTMRELVNLLSVLGKMVDYEKVDKNETDKILIQKEECKTKILKEIDELATQEEKDKAKIQRDKDIAKIQKEIDELVQKVNSQEKERLLNIKLFEDYFMHTWVPTNLDDGHVRTIYELWNKSTFEKHQFICIKMMDMLETLVCYSVDKKLNLKENKVNTDIGEDSSELEDDVTEDDDIEDDDTENDENIDNINSIKPINMSIEELKTKFSNQNSNCLSYSVGDVVSLLDALSARYIDQQIGNFVFAVKTIYTITMHNLAYKEQSSTGDEPNDIYKFVGGDLWGQTKRNVIRGARGQLSLNTRDIINGLPAESSYLKEKFRNKISEPIINMTFFSNYPSVKKGNFIKNIGEIIYENSFISSNSMFRSMAEFNIDNIFVSAIDLRATYKRSGLTDDDYNYTKYESNIKEKLNCELLNKITVNYELNESIKQYCIKNRGSKKLKKIASADKYANHFNDMVNKSLLEIDYIRYFKESFYIIPDNSLINVKEPKELGEIFVKCFDSTVPKAIKISIKPIKPRVDLDTKYVDLDNEISIMELNYMVHKDKINYNAESRIKELKDLLDRENSADTKLTIGVTLRDLYNSLANELLDKIDEIKHKEDKKEETQEQSGKIPSKIIPLRKVIKAKSLKKYIDDIEENIKYYIRDEVHSYELNRNIQELENLRIAEDPEKNISSDLKEKYNSLANEVINIIEEIKNSQAGGNVNVDGESSDGASAGGTSSGGASSVEPPTNETPPSNLTPEPQKNDTNADVENITGSSDSENENE